MNKKRSTIQPSMKDTLYSRALFNNPLQSLIRTAIDIKNIGFESMAEIGVGNVLNITQYRKCKFKQKTLLTHESYNNNDAKQEMDYKKCIIDQTGLNRDHRESNGEEYDEDTDTSSANLAPEFEAPKNNSKYIENLENKSEINEKTEQDLQGNDELKRVNSNDNKLIIDHAEILEVSNETALTEANDNFNIDILENVIVKPAKSSRNDKLLQISNANHEKIDDIAHGIVDAKNNDNCKQISNGSDAILETSDEIVLKQAKNNLKVKEMPKNARKKRKFTNKSSNKPKDIEIMNLNNESNSETSETELHFDDFKVPKKVTQSKRKKVIKPQPRFVLTHVVSGFIIQESNFAFPIIEPQSQRTKPKTSNTEKATPKEVKEGKNVVKDEAETSEPILLTEERGADEPIPTEVKEETVGQEETGTNEPAPLTEMKEKGIGIEEPVSLEIKEEEVDQEHCVAEEKGLLAEDVKDEEANRECNPFKRLQQSTVKSWTVEDLSSHLHSYNWQETASILEDNEVDGASLFWVTKAQLMIIGVSEEHADVISEFVQSGSSRGN